MIDRLIDASRRVACLAVLFATLGAVPANALELELSDGLVVSGEVAWTAGKTVFLQSADGRLELLKKSKLAAGSLAEIEAWESNHPDRTELPTKFDDAPQVLKKRVPRRSELQGVRDAVIMLALVVGTDGAVEEVLVKDASDERIIEPTRDAVAHWQFAPLEVDSAPSRGVVFMPVQF